MDTPIKLFPQSPNYQVAEIEIHYRNKVKPSERPKVQTSAQAYEILLSTWNPNTIEYREEFKVLLLNQASRVLGIIDISLGGVAATIVDAKIVFGAALKANASSILLAHNHPSGNTQPSEPDKHLTNKLKQAGKLLDIKVLDHIIVSTEGFYSFADEGML
jgi:DNA repair protein RadC